MQDAGIFVEGVAGALREEDARKKQIAQGVSEGSAGDGDDASMPVMHYGTPQEADPLFEDAPDAGGAGLDGVTVTPPAGLPGNFDAPAVSPAYATAPAPIGSTQDRSDTSTRFSALSIAGIDAAADAAPSAGANLAAGDLRGTTAQVPGFAGQLAMPAGVVSAASDPAVAPLPDEAPADETPETSTPAGPDEPPTEGGSPSPGDGTDPAGGGSGSGDETDTPTGEPSTGDTSGSGDEAGGDGGDDPDGPGAGGGTTEDGGSDGDGSGTPDDGDVSEPFNETPEGIALDPDVLAENAPGAVAGRLSATDPEGGALAWTVSDDRFEVAEGVLKLRDGVALDAEAEAAVTLEVTATDAGGLAASRTLELPVADVNEAPYDLTMSGGHVAVGAAAGSVAAQLTAVDPDAGDTHVFEILPVEATLADTLLASDDRSHSVAFAGDDAGWMWSGLRLTSVGRLQTGEDTTSVWRVRNAGDDAQQVELHLGGATTELKLQPHSDTYVALDGVGTAWMMRDGWLTGIQATAPDDFAAGDGAMTIIRDLPFEIDGDRIVLKEGAALDPTAAPFHEMDVRVTDAGGLSYVETVRIAVDAEAPAAPDSDRILLRTGFNVELFDPGRASVPSAVDWSATPERTGLVRELDLHDYYDLDDGRGKPVKPAIRVTGQIEVEEGGTYTFRASVPHDEMILSIDGHTVGRNGDGSVALESGIHDVEILYLPTGKPRFPVKWSGPDHDGMEVLSASTDLDIDQNDLLHVDMDYDGADPAAVFLSNLPQDTIVMDGHNSVVSTGSAIDVSGWNTDNLTLAPPPHFAGTIRLGIRVDDVDGLHEQATFEIDVRPTIDGYVGTHTSGSEPFVMADFGWLDAADGSFLADLVVDVMDEIPVEPDDRCGDGIAFHTYERHDW